MEESQAFDSCQYAAPSPSGAYIASLTQGHLYIQWSRSLQPAFTFPLEGPRAENATSSTIKWSHDSSHVLLVSAQGITVLSLENTALRIHIDNGSGSLGKLSAAEFVGDAGHEQVLVVWEFGKVSLWDTSSGKGTDLDDVKTGGTGPLWAVRRAQGSIGVLALLSRRNAKDVLSLYVSSSPSPFKTVTLPTTDAQAIAWSPSGRFLAVLDSPLASPSVYFYTPDGHCLRSYPNNGKGAESDDLGLGYRSMTWSPSSIAFTHPDSRVAVLDESTFSVSKTLSHDTITAASNDINSHLTALQETISASGLRLYQHITAPSLPRPTRSSAIRDTQIRFNATGSHIAIWDDGTPNTVTIWDAKTGRPHSVLVQHSPVKRLSWHPSYSDTVLIQGQDQSLYVWRFASDSPPVHLEHQLLRRAEGRNVEARFLASSTSPETGNGHQKTSILVTTRDAGWTVLWPEGRPELDMRGDAGDIAPSTPTRTGQEEEDDSLYGILTGKTPLPELGSGVVGGATMTDGMTIREEDGTGLEDTFRDKKSGLEGQERHGKAGVSLEDDSEIF